jgi:hypothetical protein
VAWGREGAAFAGSAVAWQDASRTLVLAVWYETAEAEQAVEALDDLRRALAVTLPLTAQIARTADAAAGEMPQISRRAIEILVARRPAADLPTLFRDGLAAASDGFPRLGPEQAGDVRAAQPTRPDEDTRAMRAMAAAVKRLPETSRERLRTILEHAIAVALQPRPAVADMPGASEPEPPDATEPDVDPASDEP